MKRSAIYHRAGGAHAYPLDDQNLRVMVQAARGDLTAVTCVHGDRYRQADEDGATPLVRAGSDEQHDYWVGTLPAPARRVKYQFHLQQGNRGAWLGERGFAASRAACPPFHYAYLNPADAFRLPDWLAGTVIYQIFPDRFARSRPEVTPPGAESWDTEPTFWTKTGGDLAGIQQHLPWLTELGAGCIYLTPVFASPSCHRYDTTDYYRIEPMLGAEADLSALVASAHAAGLRLMLDGVFNHCGGEFFAFQDVMARGRQSPYWDWFDIEAEPVRPERGNCNYETFSRDVPEMPKLMTQNPAVREYFLQVAEHWLRQVGIDGWRLDVANEVDHRFWREFRERVRAVAPQGFILGEVWCDALPWLQGDQYDSVTHYPWRDAVLALLNGQLDVAGFDAALTRLRFAYPGFVTGGLVHLLGSHDTERLLTAVGGSRAKARQAAVLLLTAQGVPLVYYGDEVGMAGGNDPECRRCMVWAEEQQDQELLALYRRLGQLRRALPWLNTGGWHTLRTDAAAGVYVYKRSGELALNAAPAAMAAAAPDEAIWVLLNVSGGQRQVRVDDLPAGAVDLLDPHFAPLAVGEIVLPPWGAAVLGAGSLVHRLRLGTNRREGELS